MRYEKSCGAIIVKNNKVLLIQQNDGFYGFPKGHMENNETEIATAIREVKEETNISILINPQYRYFLSYIVRSTINKEVVYFLGKVLDDSHIIKQEQEIKDIFWCEIEKVEEVLTFENLKELWHNAYQDIQNNFV